MKLAWWRSQIEQLYKDGRGDHPVMQALAPHVQAFDLDADRLYAIVEGMEMDLDQTRYADWPGLRKYCWHAAGVVGELSAISEERRVGKGCVSTWRSRGASDH